MLITKNISKPHIIISIKSIPLFETPCEYLEANAQIGKIWTKNNWVPAAIFPTTSGYNATIFESVLATQLGVANSQIFRLGLNEIRVVTPGEHTVDV